MFNRARMMIGTALAFGTSLIPDISRSFGRIADTPAPIGKRHSRNRVANDKRAAVKRRNQQRHKRVCRGGAN